MTANPEPVDELIDMVAATIAHGTSHAHKKHLREFNDESFEPVLKTPEDLRRHMVGVLCSEESAVVAVGARTCIYHEPTGTVIVINATEGRVAKDGGTVFRNDPAKDRDGEPWYLRRVSMYAERVGIDLENVKEHKGSFRRFLQLNPEHMKNLRDEITPVHQAKMQQDAAVAIPATTGPAKPRAAAPALSR